MQDNEFLLLANRSSGPLKRRLILPNGVGIVDADYYDNDSNEGEIFFQLINYGLTDYHIKRVNELVKESLCHSLSLMMRNNQSHGGLVASVQPKSNIANLE